MQLKTLGGLSLEGSKLVRLKPLLLLCYLTHEGPKERRFLVELFWPTAEKGLASLSSALYRIHQEAPGAIHSDELRIWTQLKTDAQNLLKTIQQETFDISLYGGAFLQGLDIPELSEELEEWILTTRDTLTQKVQTTLLKQAEKMASLGQFEPAAERIQNLLNLPGSTGLEPEDLLRCYPILLASDHDLAKNVRNQLAEFDIQITLNPQEAKDRLRQIFVGRTQEIEALLSLQAGQWAWLKGGVGLGKTSILSQLPGRYLAGQSGLPYATLEPLVGEAVQQGVEAILRRLIRQESFLLLDNWEQCDPESQSIFTKLKGLKGVAKVVISSTLPPPFGVDKIIELSPLSKDHLDPSLWRQTGGIPRLVGAYVRGEPLEQSLATTLYSLPENARHLYLALALLQDPDLGLVRRALKLSASDFADALEVLLGAGLAQVSGKVWPRELARKYLQNQPRLRANLALNLARQLQPKDALELYHDAKDLWEDQDIEALKEAYISHSKDLIERGFPQKAAELLGEAPKDDEVMFWRAYALERTGHLQEALNLLIRLKVTDDNNALTSNLYRRLGNTKRSEKLAKQVISKNSSLWSRALAFHNLGEITRAAKQFSQAVEYHQRATVLWRLLNNHSHSANSLNCLAQTYHDMGESLQKIIATYQEALQEAGDNPRLKSIILGNMAVVWDQHGKTDKAIEIYHQSIHSSLELGLDDVLAYTWHNLGYLYHCKEHLSDAKSAYEQALKYAQKTGEQSILGTTLANLAEITEDYNAWQEGLRILESIGHHALADSFRKNLLPNHSFKQKVS